MLAEVEGTVQGHRDGHGFVVRDDRQADLYLSPQEMRAVLHRDRVKARVVRYDRKGRPEGRVLEIIERKKAPIIGRLLHESGIWLRRARRQALRPGHPDAEERASPTRRPARWSRSS